MKLFLYVKDESEGGRNTQNTIHLNARCTKSRNKLPSSSDMLAELDNVHGNLILEQASGPES
jgi:hypothetical protein